MSFLDKVIEKAMKAKAAKNTATMLRAFHESDTGKKLVKELYEAQKAAVEANVKATIEKIANESKGH